MALLGFELLFESIRSQINSSDDAAIAAVHWNLISNGLKCCGIGESWPDTQTENRQGKELLPAGWNQDSTIYTLRYVDPTSNRTYLMKALAIDGTLILHLMRCYDEKTYSTSIKSRDFVTENRDSVDTAYRALSVLNNQVDKELYEKLFGEGPGKRPRVSASDTSASSSRPGPSRDERQPGRSPLQEDPTRGPGGGVGFIPPRAPLGPGIRDPFNIGGRDLDPFGQGGGMFMDPRNLPGRGGFRPGAQPMPGFPPGSVPPGARFDPVGPPGVRPEPDPDHERPPDFYDDMFM